VLLAIAAAVAIVLSAPFMGQIRSALQAALPSGAYRAVLGAIVAGAVLAAVGVGVVRIRERRALRYGAILLSLAIGVGYARLSATGNANVDLVERIHFVEYGLLALLFFRAWRDRGDPSMIVATFLACTIVAFVDEWLQWFLPARVGEIRDVALNAIAVACGLLFALGLDLPRRMQAHMSRKTARVVAVLSAATVLTGAAFVDIIHLGHEVTWERSTLRSRFTEVQLDALSIERAKRWSQDGPPLTLQRLSREDQYLAEGLWHVQHRNEAASAGEAQVAWRENLILERFFAPVLEWPSYAAPTASRWPPAQRENVAAAESLDDRPYVSQAAPFPLLMWNRVVFWAIAGLAAAGVGSAVDKWGRA
jgi:VanZ like protein